jgi:hypothetical protein
MTEAEQTEENVWKRRYLKLVEEGLDSDEAHELAAQMMMRDRDSYDDRRVCPECTHYKNKLCNKILEKNKPTQQLRFILQRCDHFELRGKK